MVLPACLVSSSETIQLFDRQGDVALRLVGHTRGVNAVSWSPDASLLASASWDGTVRLWDGSGRCLRVIEGFSDAVESVDFSPAGDLIAASRDRTIRRLDPEGPGGKPDGAPVVLATLDCAPSRAAVSPDGRLLAIATEDHYAVLLDRTTGAQRNVPHPGTVYGVAWSRDGRLATACEDGAARVFDRDGEPLHQSAASAMRAVQVAWHPDGVHLTVGLREGKARVLDADLSPVLTIENGKEVTMLAWAPEGDMLAVGSGKGDLAFWHVLP